jgi:hypothetical protein
MKEYMIMLGHYECTVVHHSFQLFAEYSRSTQVVLSLQPCQRTAQKRTDKRAYSRQINDGSSRGESDGGGGGGAARARLLLLDCGHTHIITLIALLRSVEGKFPMSCEDILKIIWHD